MLHDRPCQQRLQPLSAVALTVLLLASLAACAAPGGPTAGQPKSLLLQGYNYTDHYIDSFSVNGQGGGNIFASSPDSGGGKSACCVIWHPGSKLPVTIKVRWTASYCMTLKRTKFGEYDERQSIYREQEALITEAIADKPRALEVHFFRDGHIEAAVTDGDSPPRLKLPRDANYNRPGVSQEVPRCANDIK